MELKIVKASHDEPANAIIERAGIETVHHDLAPTQWIYEGKVIQRPLVNRWEAVALEEFGIKVEYTDGEAGQK
jgi:hypothetical protein